ncbi:MAG: hypothetical protein RLZZ519_2086 [Bacteroidota bacterium]|jgi:hypothetical protein
MVNVNEFECGPARAYLDIQVHGAFKLGGQYASIANFPATSKSALMGLRWRSFSLDCALRWLTGGFRLSHR